MSSSSAHNLPPKPGLQIAALHRPDPAFGVPPSQHFINATSDTHPKSGSFNQTGPCGDSYGIDGLAYGLGEIKLKSSFAKQLIQERLSRNPDLSTASGDIVRYTSIPDEETASVIVLPRSKDGKPIPLPITSSAMFYSPKINLLNKHIPSPSVKRSITKYALPQHHPVYHQSITKAISDHEQYKEKHPQFSGPLAHILAQSTYAQSSSPTSSAALPARSSISTHSSSSPLLPASVPSHSAPSTPLKPRPVHNCTEHNCGPHNAAIFTPSRLADTVAAIAKSDYHRGSRLPSHCRRHERRPDDVLAGCTGVADGSVHNVCGRPRCLCACGDAQCSASFTPDFLTLNKHVQYSVLQMPSTKGKLRKKRNEEACVCNCDVNCSCTCMDDEDCECGMKPHLHRPEYYTKVNIANANSRKTPGKTENSQVRKTPSSHLKHRDVYAELRENPSSESSDSENSQSENVPRRLESEMAIVGTHLPINDPKASENVAFSGNNDVPYTSTSPDFSRGYQPVYQYPYATSSDTMADSSSQLRLRDQTGHYGGMCKSAGTCVTTCSHTDVNGVCTRGCCDYWRQKQQKSEQEAKLASIHHPENPVHKRIHGFSLPSSPPPSHSPSLPSSSTRADSAPTSSSSHSVSSLPHSSSTYASPPTPNSPGKLHLPSKYSEKPTPNRAGVVSVRVNTYTALDHPDTSKDSLPYVTDRALLIAEREKALLQWQAAKLAEEEFDRALKREEEDARRRGKPWDNSRVRDFYFGYGFPRSAEYAFPEHAYGRDASSGLSHAYTPKQASCRSRVYQQLQHTAIASASEPETDSGVAAPYNNAYHFANNTATGDTAHATDGTALAATAVTAANAAAGVGPGPGGAVTLPGPASSPVSRDYNSNDNTNTNTNTNTNRNVNPSRPPLPSPSRAANTNLTSVPTPLSATSGASRESSSKPKGPFFPPDAAFASIDLETPRPAAAPPLRPTPAPTPAHSRPAYPSVPHAGTAGAALADTLPTGATVRFSASTQY